jgi:ribosomal protein L37AE/L43A
MIVAERPAEQETRREPPPLRQGDHLRCPHCRHWGDEGTFTRIGTHPDYARVTVPVWRCPACRRHFALRPQG